MHYMPHIYVAVLCEEMPFILYTCGQERHADAKIQNRLKLIDPCILTTFGQQIPNEKTLALQVWVEIKRLLKIPNIGQNSHFRTFKTAAVKNQERAITFK